MNGDHEPSNPDLSPSSAEQAERCRRLSRATYDRATAEMLNRMAENFERHAAPDNDLE